MTAVSEVLSTVQFDDGIDVDDPLAQDVIVIARVLDISGGSWVMVRRSQGTDDMVAGGMLMEATRQWQSIRAGGDE